MILMKKREVNYDLIGNIRHVKRFALIPASVDGNLVWLCSYYQKQKYIHLRKYNFLLSHTYDKSEWRDIYDSRTKEDPKNDY